MSLSKLPVCGSQFFGREQELVALDVAWGDPAKNILSVVAWGGTGKTALVGRWLTRLSQDNYRGAESVFGWSFSSQGSTDRVVSADEFIASALTWFGDQHPERGSTWDKGRRLADLIRARRTLLVLDGVEPLQHCPGPQEGQLKDPALQTLVRELAAQNRGLCVISTRLPVADLAEYQATTAPRLDLEGVTPADGRLILRGFNVRGPDEELEAASKEFHGHCLALNLLGSYLEDVCQGDIRRRSEIGPLQGEERGGAQARRVMQSYERWLGAGPALTILHLLGLFDRPASEGEVKVLREVPVLRGLTDGFFRRRGFLGWLLWRTPEAIGQLEWDRALAKLRRARLLADADAAQPHALDTHPLVREYFGEQIRRGAARAWRLGHDRLYRHHLSAAAELPSTLEEMVPLYAAVRHACEAGRHDEAMTTYRTRIQRGEERFSLHQLGAHGADLSALSNFFDSPWTHPVQGLSAGNKAFVLSQAARCLKALGRLRDAVQAGRASLGIAIENKGWNFAAGRAGNLSQLCLVLGELGEALSFAKQGVKLADRGRNVEQRISRRTNLGDAHHHLGDIENARSAFQEAEALQKEHWPGRPLLHAPEGFRYCNLLLTAGDHQAVIERGRQFLAWRGPKDSRLSVALDHLILGRAYLLRDKSEARNNHAEAEEQLERALQVIREAGSVHHLPRVLMARAALRRTQGDFAGADSDLAEASKIALRNGMRTDEADWRLEHAWLQLAQSDKAGAAASLAAFKIAAAEMGYRRRQGEVGELEGLLKGATRP